MIKKPMTKQGHTQLVAELNHLKSTIRPQVIAAISEARAHGDLKENAEYHAAREQQGFVEFRIKELEGKLAVAHIIDVSTLPQNGKVVFGTTIELLNVETDQTVKYQIVCEDEANFKEAKISIASPLARAMIGKEIGEVIVVTTPGGETEYEILDVLYI
jgi:transcription elongation factor GreA